MLISLNKIKSYVPGINIETSELIKLIGSRLVEVEGSIDLAPKYQGIKVAKVVTCEAIPETHLHLCQIDAGENPEADPETGLVQVVCGAPNVHAGMLAAWIMPGAIVPATYGGEDFKLSVRKLRGYESHGMLSAADELDLGTDHEGIIEIDPKDAKPGDNFADVFDLNDIILDIENKSLTHRPDCFGLIGFAREVAGILGLDFEGEISKGFSQNSSGFGEQKMYIPDACQCMTFSGAKSNQEKPLEISIADPVLCPRYSCAVLDCTKLLEKGKYFTKGDAFLGKLGMRGISPIVDLTNILMLETGQPLHAFDYDKFVAVGGAKNPKIIVRLAREGEKLQLLDGKTIDLTPSDILITSNDVPVALAGAMGGASTEIDASSTKIILESATFSLYNLRKTQMAHGIFSEAITRFTKGQPACQTLPVLSEAIRRLATEPISISDAYPAPAKQNVVKITTSEINSLLGTNYDAALIRKTLENVGFKVKKEFEITAPLWRTDIHIKEDIIEEVGRLLGYDNIPISLPTRSFTSTRPNPLWQLKADLRNILSDKLGSHEVLTYSFISGDLLDKVGEAREKSYRIVNSISPELQYFRQSLTPSLLDKLLVNLKDGRSDFTIYEINQVVDRSEALDKDGVPVSHTHLSVVTFGDFYKIKAIAEALNHDLKITNPYQATKAPAHYFEPAHSAMDTFGTFGEIRNSVLKKFKLDKYQISALEWDIEPIITTPKNPLSLAGLAFSKFPTVSRDLTFKAGSEITYGKISFTLKEALSAENLIFEITPTSIYQADNETEIRNLSFHIEFAAADKTLSGDEISGIIERVTKKIVQLGVEAV